MGTSASETAWDCLRCGACCHGDDGWVVVDGADDARVERSPSLRRLVVHLRRGDHVRRSLRMIDGACAALARSGGAVRCVIYEERPTVCRTVEVGSDTCRRARAALGL
jgi:Fe-S-cluster containining protein